MKLFAQNYIDPEGNLLDICQQILHASDIRQTRLRLSRAIEAHLEPVSLIAVQDVLKEYGIESAGVRLGEYAYGDFETPFVCALQREHWPNAALTLVTEVGEQHIRFWDPEKKREEIVSIADFKSIDKEVVLLLDDTTKQDEMDYEKNKSDEKRNKTLRQTSFCGLGILILLALFAALNSSPASSWIAVTFLLSSSIGLVLSCLLIWHDIDAFHPFLKEVCGGFGKKADCNAVLSSAGSNFFGISWSAWGMAFFSSFFAAQLFFIAAPAGYNWLAYASLFVSPYIIYSLYYQASVVRQWCPLCLFVQGVLLVNAFASYYFLQQSDVAFSELNSFALIPIAFLFFGMLALTHQAVPLLKDAKKSKDLERRWKRLRYNPDIFQSLLEKSPRITMPVEGLGIVVGNPQAKTEIIKVCNPYCGPCSNAHPELDAVIHKNPDVNVRIIFTASGREEDKRTAPVAHLLAIQQVYGVEKVKEALDDWYLAKEKDYELFAAKYPMNGELAMALKKVEAMNVWCDAMKIRATPTIFINGRELPDGYQIAELKNIL